VRYTKSGISLPLGFLAHSFYYQNDSLCHEWYAQIAQIVHDK
jgi:hypothetical protein